MWWVPLKWEQISPFRKDGSFFAHASSPFLSGTSWSSCIFKNLFWFYLLPYSLTCSWDWTCNLRMIWLKSTFSPTAPWEFWGFIKFMSPSTHEILLWGLRLKVTGKGQGCVAVWISDSIFWLFYFTPTLVSRCNALPKKVPKRIIQKEKTATDKRRRRCFYTFLYLLGSAPFHGWGSFSWIHWNGWVLS